MAAATHAIEQAALEALAGALARIELHLFALHLVAHEGAARGERQRAAARTQHAEADGPSARDHVARGAVRLGLHLTERAVIIEHATEAVRHHAAGRQRIEARGVGRW